MIMLFLVLITLRVLVITRRVVIMLNVLMRNPFGGANKISKKFRIVKLSWWRSLGPPPPRRGAPGV